MEIDPRTPVGEREEKILAYWQKENIPARSVAEREGGPRFVFYEGPPTANGRPGIHHVLARTLKDVVCRYQTMLGCQVHRKAGWDTHGLPVEIEVEKQLGLSSKQDIEAYGIEAFNKKCRESVFTYERDWRRMTERIGYWLDMDHPYITLDNSYIESIWWILQRFFQAGLIYEGHKIMPYCARCGTPLASHEVSLGYKDETIDSIYVRMQIPARPGEYFLVWTTTPWTLPANVALAVHPELTYVRARRSGDEAVYILVRERVGPVLGEDAEIISECKGAELIGQNYQQLLPFVRVEGDKAFRVYGAGFVSAEDGTGIVHCAPAFGEDDYQMGRENDLPFVQPVDKDGRFTSEVTPWAGRFVREADPDIIAYLKQQGRLYRKEKLTHAYPYCWRCDTPLLYYGRKSWYIATTKYKEKMIANNQRIKWYPEHVGRGRFGNWLENMIDWSLSRDRYWGTPLNIWRCEQCSRLASVGSRRELAELAVEDIDPDTIELHRPSIDQVHLRCDCGGRMTRTPEVIDCWFDSGSMPYGQWHYPFEHEDEFDRLFPADFICEGIDQTRGWFYSLLAISTFLFDQPAFKSVMVNDLVLDKNGQKMSKSRGNTVDPWQMLDKYGADATRWYLLAVSPPWTPTRFDEEGVKEVCGRFLGTMQNIYNFFTLYGNIDGADPAAYDMPAAERPEIDRWILSRLNSLIKQVREDMAAYELTKVVRAIQTFVIDEVSNWYVRRTRDRFWGPSLDFDKKAVYRTLWEVMTAVARLMAPFAPFIAEEIHLGLIGDQGGSVHLQPFPEVDRERIDLRLEEAMGLVIDLVSLGRAARNRVQIKVRQPLSRLIADETHRDVLEPMQDLICEELNVKAISYEKTADAYVSYTVRPNLPVLGPRYGRMLKEITAAVAAADPRALVNELRASGRVTVTVQDNALALTEADLLVTNTDKTGYAVEIGHGSFVVLDVSLDESLIAEGLAREIVSKVQNMRKNAGLELTDRIKLSYAADQELASAIETFAAYIKDETLAVSLERQAGETGVEYENWDINGHQAALKLTKAAAPEPAGL